MPRLSASAPEVRREMRPLLVQRPASSVGVRVARPHPCDIAQWAAPAPAPRGQPQQRRVGVDLDGEFRSESDQAKSPAEKCCSRRLPVGLPLQEKAHQHDGQRSRGGPTLTALCHSLPQRRVCPSRSSSAPVAAPVQFLSNRIPLSVFCPQLLGQVQRRPNCRFRLLPLHLAPAVEVGRAAHAPTPSARTFC